jgi:Fe-S-cluster containining protein
MTMMTKHKLPIIVERHLGEIQADRIRRALEFERDAIAENPISCKSGCAHCCYYPVVISPLEGLLAYRWLTSHGRWTPKQRVVLEEHAKATTGLDPTVWFLSNIACPLLEEKTRKCVAYEVRPLVCRLVMTRGIPEHCQPSQYVARNPLNQIPFRTVLNEFHQKETAFLKTHKVRITMLTLSRAILFAEQLANGTLDFNRLDLAIYTDYIGSQE